MAAKPISDKHLVWVWFGFMAAVLVVALTILPRLVDQTNPQETTEQTVDGTDESRLLVEAAISATEVLLHDQGLSLDEVSTPADEYSCTYLWSGFLTDTVALDGSQYRYESTWKSDDTLHPLIERTLANALEAELTDLGFQEARPINPDAAPPPGTAFVNAGVRVRLLIDRTPTSAFATVKITNLCRPTWAS